MESSEAPPEYSVPELIQTCRTTDLWLPTRVAVRGYLYVTRSFSLLTEHQDAPVGIIIPGSRLLARLGISLGGGSILAWRGDVTLIGEASRAELPMLPMRMHALESVEVYRRDDRPPASNVVDLRDLCSPSAETTEMHCFGRGPWLRIIGSPDDANPHVLIEPRKLVDAYESALTIAEWARLVDQKELVGHASNVRSFLGAALKFYEVQSAEHGLPLPYGEPKTLD